MPLCQDCVEELHSLLHASTGFHNPIEHCNPAQRVIHDQFSIAKEADTLAVLFLSTTGPFGEA